jgi:hypothetical protein
LEFYITNPVGSTADREASERALEVIREKIQQGDIKVGAQSSRGSGLMQIASITRQSPKSSLDFGYLDDNTFYTRVILSAIIKDRSVAVSLEGLSG